jgi:hypothetical protein
MNQFGAPHQCMGGSGFVLNALFLLKSISGTLLAK